LEFANFACSLIGRGAYRANEPSVLNVLRRGEFDQIITRKESSYAAKHDAKRRGESNEEYGIEPATPWLPLIAVNSRVD